MPKRIIAINVASILNTTGGNPYGGTRLPDRNEITLHGWSFTTHATAGIVEFRSPTGTGNQGTPIPSITSPIVFSRSIAASGLDSPWFDHQGLFLPGGLWIDLLTGAATFVGSIFVS